MNKLSHSMGDYCIICDALISEDYDLCPSCAFELEDLQNQEYDDDNLDDWLDDEDE